MSYSGIGLNQGEKPETGWEYVLVFSAPGLDKDESNYERIMSSSKTSQEELRAGAVRAEILANLRNAGFSYSQLWIPAVHKVLVRLALPTAILHEIAEKNQFPLELEDEYGGGYLSYKKEREQCFVNRNYSNFFTPSERLKITISVMESKSAWGAGINVDKLKTSGILIDSYPLHNRLLRREMKNQIVFQNWWNPFFEPSYRRIRDYWGSRIAMYFGFLKFFTRMLVGISAISIPSYFLLKYTTSNAAVCVFRFIFSFILVFWSAYFIKFWKRRNSALNVRWGTFDEEDDNSFEVRPEFIGNPRKGFYSKGGFVDLSELSGDSESYASRSVLEVVRTENSITGKLRGMIESYRNIIDLDIDELKTGTVIHDLPSNLYSSRYEHRKRIVLSWIVTIWFSAIMVAFIFLPTLFQEEIASYFSSFEWAASTPGLLTGTLIMVAQQIWMQVYPSLSKWENHRTTQSYLNSLIIKRFSVEFVVNFASLFYIAFIKPFVTPEECGINVLDEEPDCFSELQSMVSGVVISKVSIEQFLEVFVPGLMIVFNRLILWFAWWLRGTSNELREELLETKTNVEGGAAEDIKEEGLNTFENTIEDYGELVIQFGFVALFGLAYPIAPLVFFFNNVIELRTDAFKYLYIFNRPKPQNSNSIGRWIFVLKFVMWVSTWTNSALLVIFNPYESRSYATAIIFFCLQNIFMFVITGIGMTFEDIPGNVHVAYARQNFLIARIFGVDDKPYYHDSIAEQTKDEVVDENVVNRDLFEAAEQSSSANEANQGDNDSLLGP